MTDLLAAATTYRIQDKIKVKALLLFLFSPLVKKLIPPLCSLSHTPFPVLPINPNTSTFSLLPLKKILFSFSCFTLLQYSKNPSSRKTQNLCFSVLTLPTMEAFSFLRYWRGGGSMLVLTTFLLSTSAEQ